MGLQYARADRAIGLERSRREGGAGSGRQEAGGRRQEAGNRKLCDVWQLGATACRLLPSASCRLPPAVCFLPPASCSLELILVFVLVVIFFNDIQFDRVEADDL